MKLDAPNVHVLHVKGDPKSLLQLTQSELNALRAPLLRPFEGRSVIDEAGQSHPLETDPNTLHQLFAVEEPFHQIYKLVQ